MADDNLAPIPEMVERGALALHQSIRDRLLFRVHTWDEYSEGDRQEFYKHASDMIEAMREPTEAMKMAGMEPILPQTKPHAKELEPICQKEAGDAWRAMIDAALGR